MSKPNLASHSRLETQNSRLLTPGYGSILSLYLNPSLRIFEIFSLIILLRNEDQL